MSIKKFRIFIYFFTKSSWK